MYMYIFAPAHDVLWKDLERGSLQKLILENLVPLLNSGLGLLSLSKMLMDNLCWDFSEIAFLQLTGRTVFLVPLNLPKDLVSRQLLALCSDISGKANW